MHTAIPLDSLIVKQRHAMIEDCMPLLLSWFYGDISLVPTWKGALPVALRSSLETPEFPQSLLLSESLLLRQ